MNSFNLIRTSVSLSLAGFILSAGASFGRCGDIKEPVDPTPTPVEEPAPTSIRN